MALAAEQTPIEIPVLQIADIELPIEMERLRDLAYDLWWSWSPQATRLFTWIDPEHWQRYHNPVQLLINVEPYQWQRLLGDPEFRNTFDSVIQASTVPLAAALVRARTRELLPGPVAYFSMDSGSTSRLGVYSGAGRPGGDHCKAPARLGVPLVGVGALYRSGYFRQTGTRRLQQHIYPDYDLPGSVLPVQAAAGGHPHRAHRPARPAWCRPWCGRRRWGGSPPDARHRRPPERPADRPINGMLTCAGRENAPVPGDRAGVGGCGPCAPWDSRPRGGT